MDYPTWLPDVVKKAADSILDHYAQYAPQSLEIKQQELSRILHSTRLREEDFWNRFLKSLPSSSESKVIHPAYWPQQQIITYFFLHTMIGRVVRPKITYLEMQKRRKKLASTFYKFRDQYQQYLEDDPYLDMPSVFDKSIPQVLAELKKSFNWLYRDRGLYSVAPRLPARGAQPSDQSFLERQLVDFFEKHTGQKNYTLVALAVEIAMDLPEHLDGEDVTKRYSAYQGEAKKRNPK